MKRWKRLFGASLVAVAMLAAGCASTSSGNADKATEVVGSDSDVSISHVRQLVAADNKTGRTVMWSADVKQNYTMEYRVAGTKDSKTVQAEDSSFDDVKHNYIEYTAKLSDLKAGTNYEYRINSEKNKGSWHKLHTDDGGNFTALIFPDSQSANYSGWQKLARDARERNKEASLFVNMGDLVDNGQDASQWRAWFNAVEPFSRDIPLAPMPGNHEAYSLEWKVAQPVAYTHLFNVPQNGDPQKYPNQFYSFDYGDVHFTVLDTNFIELKEWQPDLWADQMKWLEQDLSKSKAKWKIVLQHRDIFMYSFGPESGRPAGTTHFLDFSYDEMPIFEKYKVDAVLTAHLHTYRRRMPLLNREPNPEGITYILTGVAGDVRYAKLWGDFEWDAGTAPKPETANYMTLDVTKDALTFKAFLPDGKMFDEVTLKK